MNIQIIKSLPETTKTAKPATQIVAHLPETGFLLMWWIIGSERRNIQGLIPMSRSSWLNGVNSGKYPKPVKLGERVNAWRAEDIRALIEKLGA